MIFGRKCEPLFPALSPSDGEREKESGSCRLVHLLVLLSLAAVVSPAVGATNQISFNRDIRPILSENCYACHGPDKNQRKAKLRLDIREVALEREAIVPGKPEESKLIEHILATDPDEIMPPPKSHKKLTAKQKELLKKWVAAG